jgi:hypothetical protein
VLGDKLAFERRLVTALRDRAWFGGLSDFGCWWAARHEVEVDVTEAPTGRMLRLNAPQKLQGLTLHLPRGWRFQSCEPASVQVTEQTDAVVLGEIGGPVDLHFSAPED